MRDGPVRQLALTPGSFAVTVNSDVSSRCANACLDAQVVPTFAGLIARMAAASLAYWGGSVR